jgi:hypothetical protein
LELGSKVLLRGDSSDTDFRNCRKYDTTGLYCARLLTAGVSGGVACECSCKDCVARLLLTASVLGGVVCKYSCKEYVIRL